MVFNVNMYFTWKSRCVLDGNRNPEPEGSLYDVVVSRESVSTSLTYMALNGINMFVSDRRNAYLQATSSNNDYIICGSEFGLEKVVKKALTRR